MSDTRENIIDLAEELIRTKGYNAFSYGDIAEVLHIRNAAIHYYFPSKADLGVNVVDREVGKIASSRGEWGQQPGNVQLRKMVEQFYGSHRKGWICLNGSLTPDFLTLPGPLQQKVKQMCEAILDWMTDALQKGRKDGTLAFEGEAESRALLVISSLLSSLLLARVLGAPVFNKMLDQLLRDIEHIPDGQQGLDKVDNTKI
jgi:AcrR family transcriptional regulator